MNTETIVAVFDTTAHAAAAVADLINAGVPQASISQHQQVSPDGSTTIVSGTEEKRGFWSNLFGAEPERDHDTGVYDRSMASGATIVTIKAAEGDMDQVLAILEQHNPVDIDERAASYVETTTSYMATPVGAPKAVGPAMDEGVIQLSEESLAVGKRAVNRGTTRVRRYVVDTPVSEDVTLRDETVSVVRRPVADGTAVPASAFTDKVIEMTETDEEVVVGKTARVVEEVVISKDVSERVETVKDTLRRDEVEITKEPGVGPGAMSTPLIDKI